MQQNEVRNRLTPGATSLICWALYHSGLVSLFRLKQLHNRVAILNYHHAESHGFERHLQYICRYYKPISLNCFIELDSACELLERDLVIVTFDDGYADNFTNAFPLAAKYNVPLTIFLAMNFIGSSQLPWWHRIDWALESTSARSLTVDGEELDLSSHPAKKNASARLRQFVKHWPAAEVELRLDRIMCQLQVSEQAIPGIQPWLNWEQVVDMSAHGIEFGSHALSHRILTRIPVEDAKMEIRESKKELERRLSKGITSFAYPNGQPNDYSPVLQQVLAESGYSCALTSVYGFNNLKSDMFALRRCGADSSDSIPVLAVRLCGLWPFVERIRHLAGQRRVY